jgi:hypothetical protein
MVARFEKDDMKFLDGFDKDTWYQMVPAMGGIAANSFPWRFMTVVTESHACKLTVDDPTLIGLSNIGSPILFNEIAIPANQRRDFLIVARGQTAGVTSVKLTDVDNFSTLVNTLMDSVKTEVQGRYAIIMLSDTRPGQKPDATTRSPAQAVRLMQLVAATYMAQANVNLTQVGAPTSVMVPSDLGNPLNVDDMNSVLNPILAATPASFMGSDVNRIYCCWDVADNTLGSAPLGDTRGKNCFVEDGTNEFTFAHELGHALGLKSHNMAATSARPLLMDESLGKGTFKLQQFEIDLLNPSGLFGTP